VKQKQRRGHKKYPLLSKKSNLQYLLKNYYLVPKKELAKRFQCPKQYLYFLAKEYKIADKNRFSCFDTFFEKINSESKAYFLGLLYADGCILHHKKQTRNPAMSLALQETDVHILETFRQKLKYKGKLHFRKRKNIDGYNRQDTWALHITSKKLVNDLIKLGCTSKKTFDAKLPNKKQVPEKFLRHFIRGFFDGDGCVNIRNTGFPTPMFRCNFAGTHKMCYGINKLFHNQLGFQMAKLQPNKSIFVYCFGGNQQMRKFYHYLYDGASVFLKRKEEKMRQVFNY
jgi:hypothetical protein